MSRAHTEPTHSANPPYTDSTDAYQCAFCGKDDFNSLHARNGHFAHCRDRRAWELMTEKERTKRVRQVRGSDSEPTSNSGTASSPGLSTPSSQTESANSSLMAAVTSHTPGDFIALCLGVVLGIFVAADPSVLPDITTWAVSVASGGSLANRLLRDRKAPDWHAFAYLDAATAGFLLAFLASGAAAGGADFSAFIEQFEIFLGGGGG